MVFLRNVPLSFQFIIYFILFIFYLGLKTTLGQFDSVASVM